MKKTIIAAALLLALAPAHAQDITSIIGEGITKVIRAVDLQVQRFQTQTIGLQEAQKTLENVMAATELDDIRDWVQRQKDLYGEYFAELQQVKTVITGYHKIKDAIQRQETILQLYQQGLARFRQDGHFTAIELAHIESVFTTLLNESEQNLDQLLKATTALTFQMTDQQRLATVDRAADGIDRNYRDIQTFTQQNQLLSLQRAQDENDYQTLLKLYGL